MKTPRQLLFEKHKGATPALDLVRRRALDAAFARTTAQSERTEHVSLISRMLQELFLPYRRAWAGLAGAWVFVLGFTVASLADSPTIEARVSPASREMVLAIRKQKQELIELVQLAPVEPVEPPRLEPQPRSSLWPVNGVG